MPPSKRTEYAWRGWQSTRPHPQGQGQLPGVDPHPDFQELGGAERLNPKQKAAGEKVTGLSQGGITRRMGQHLDDAFANAEREHLRSGGTPYAQGGPPVHMQGQQWYDSSATGSHAHGVAQIAKEHDMPYHTVAGIKANTAQNINPTQENRVTRQILEQDKRGVEPKDMTGSTYRDVVVRAGAHTQNPAADPLETKARNARSHSEEESDIPFALGHGYKKPGYYQSYVHPHDERTRPAIDRHMFRAGTNMSEEDIKKQQMGSGKGTLNTDVGLAGGSASPAHRLVDQGVRNAAKARGLGPVEAQTGIWHVVNPQQEEHPSRPVDEAAQMGKHRNKAVGQGNVSPTQFNLF